MNHQAAANAEATQRRRRQASVGILLLLMAIAILAPILILSGFFLWRNADIQRAALEAAAQTRSRSLATEIDRELDRRLAVLHALASSRSIQAGDKAEFLQQARRAIGRDGEGWILLFDRDLRLLASTDPDSIGPRVNEVYREVFTTGRSLVSGGIRRPSTGELLAVLSVPVRDASGQVTHGLGYAVTPTLLHRLIQEELLPGTWISTIADRHGTILARTHDASRWLGRQVTAEWAAILRARGEGIAPMMVPDGMPVYGFLSPIRTGGWGLGVGIPLEEFNAPLRRLLLQSIAIAVFTTAAAGMLAFLVARRIQTPLRVLSRAALAIGRREPVEVPASPVAEIDNIARSLQAAAGERDRAEQDLVAAEARYRAIVETAVDSIVVIDEAGIIAAFNQAAEKMFGFTSGELIGRNIAILMPEPDRALHDTYIGNYLRTGIPKIIGIGREVIGRRRDGATFPLDLAIAEWRIDNQRYFTGIMRDITERRRSQEQILELNATLERRVEERTRELEEAYSELDNFARSVSHDLRAPLRTMQGFSNALLEDYGEKLDDLGRDYARRIVAGATRLDELIKDLLDYSRLTRAEIRLQPVSLDGVADDVLSALRSSIAEKGTEITVVRPLGRVRGHPAVLLQAISNLVDNALKFTRPGVRPRVTLHVERIAPRRLRLWVEDNGIGIAPEHQHRVFEVFQRLHSQAEYPGTGIGLAIVRKGIERLGGSIGVASRLGEGSRFWIELAEESEPAEEAVR